MRFPADDKRFRLNVPNHPEIWQPYGDQAQAVIAALLEDVCAAELGTSVM
jgi:hypothetical protein